MKNTFKYISFLMLGTVLFTSCKKEFDDPTIKEISTGTIMTIADVRAMNVPGQTVYINSDISVYGVVTMDETTGNLYKESYISDETGSLYLRFISGSGLYTGDSIQVNLNGAKIIRYNQMLQIDSLHPDNNIVKIGTQQFRAPELTTIEALLANLEDAQGKLVQIDGSFFADGGQGLSFADAVTQTAGSRSLFALNGDEIEVRTSGYANFANEIVPSGTGSFIGIVAQYNDGLQLLIRDPQELIFSGTSPLVKTFNDQSITSGGWTTQVIEGSVDWATNFQGAESDYAFISNFSTGVASQVWLISPSNDFSNSTSPSLGFRNAANYSGPNLETFISTNYDGVSSPSTATWTPVTAILSSGGFEFVSSGVIDLSAFLNANTYIGFKYSAPLAGGKTWEIDNIIINK
jgi:hypothetical protein